MAIVVHSGDLLLGAGDSITARRWAEATGSLYDILAASMTSKVVYSTSATGAVAATMNPGSVPAVNRGFRTVNTAVNQQKTGDVLANINTQILSWAPDVLILLIGVNDIGGRIAPATIESNYDAILSQTRAALPNVRIGCVSILCFGEGWTGPANAPVWNNGPTDVDLEAVNAYIRDTLCPAYNATYIDLRSRLLAIEPSINPTQANNAFTIDGVHPIIQASEVTMGQWAASYVSVVP